MEKILSKQLGKHFKGDIIIWSIVLGLSILSILVVYSATQTIAYKQMEGDASVYLFRHARLVVLALVVMWIAHRIDYRYYARVSMIALYISVPLLIYAMFFGVRINEASRWITIPFINQTFQPSDLAKLALITHLATMLSRKQQDIENIQQTILPMLGWVSVICALIGYSNFSNAMMLFFTCMLVMFIGRVPVRYFLILVIVGSISIGAALTFGQRGRTAMNRIEAFLNADKQGFQMEQSYVAIAGGGITGKGPGQSDQRNYLPYPFSDFIYAIVVEEYGMIGAAAVLFMYLALLYRGMIIMARSNRAFGGILSAGLAFSLVVQAMTHMCVTVGLVPTTGLPLPLLSMGGTSLLFTGISLGVILSISRGDIVEEN